MPPGLPAPAVPPRGGEGARPGARPRGEEGMRPGSPPEEPSVPLQGAAEVRPPEPRAPPEVPPRPERWPEVPLVPVPGEEAVRPEVPPGLRPPPVPLLDEAGVEPEVRPPEPRAPPEEPPAPPRGAAEVPPPPERPERSPEVLLPPAPLRGEEGVPPVPPGRAAVRAAAGLAAAAVEVPPATASQGLRPPLPSQLAHRRWRRVAPEPSGARSRRSPPRAPAVVGCGSPHRSWDSARRNAPVSAAKSRRRCDDPLRRPHRGPRALAPGSSGSCSPTWRLGFPASAAAVTAVLPALRPSRLADSTAGGADDAEDPRNAPSPQGCPVPPPTEGSARFPARGDRGPMGGARTSHRSREPRVHRQTTCTRAVPVVKVPRLPCPGSAGALAIAVGAGARPPAPARTGGE